MRRGLWKAGWLGCALMASTVASCGQSAKHVSGAWSVIEANVAERDFYGLATMESDPAILQSMAADSELAAVRQQHANALAKALLECKDVPCMDRAMRWSDADIAAVGEALRQELAHDSAMQSYVKHILRGSGRFVLYEKEPDAQLLSSMWQDTAHTMNRIVDVYGDGVPPRYAHIDSMRYDPKSPTYMEAVHAIGAMIALEDTAQMPFFFPEMKYAVMLLATNGRPDAARYEPLSGENAAAVRRAKMIAWRSYPYTVIVVPGEGPEQPDVELSPLGRIRVEMAVRLFREGKAPFILVSGGNVHPMLTKFCEAIEMRKELITQWNIPADAILIDPYARHTTTNLRNAVREVIRYGIPTDKPMLISSDQAQAGMILKPAFDVRCMTEMHLRPWLSLHVLSATEIEMMPNRDSLQEDASDPMDP